MNTTGSSSVAGTDGPITIADWKAAQASGDPLSRLLGLASSLDLADPAWISLANSDHIQHQWQKIQRLKEQGHELPLFGIPFAVKDNTDVAGLPTTAACPDFSYVPVQDAAVIQVLQAAGAVVVGKTNLDAFATGLVGTRSSYGAVPNTFDSRYISGGSSSGSASVVARGLVPFALGTDTAGSGRVPAALNNVIGLKPTRGALSARGVVPACRSLDCVSILALTIEDVGQVFDVAASYDEEDSYSRPIVAQPPFTAKKPRIAICDNPPWFDRDLHCDAYLQALSKAERLGWSLEPTSFLLLFNLAEFLYGGPWLAERFSAIKEFINKPDVEMDPVVRSIIQRGSSFSAVDLFTHEYERAALTRAIEEQFNKYDAILVPTTPIFPTLEDVSKEPVLENSRLGTYTNFVNFLDWSALSVPAGFRFDGLPFGLTIISTRWQEETLLQLGTQWLAAAPRRLGATRTEFRESLTAREYKPTCDDTSPLVIVGAHLSGFPLNHQLKEAGANLRCTTTTSPSYRLYDLSSATNIKKPGLKRIVDDCELGYSIEVEIWDISSNGLGDLLTSVSPPLAIGSVEISDGTWMKGFVCEPWGLKNALDISSFGGWRAYMASLDVDQAAAATQTGDKSSNNPRPLFSSVLIANRGEIAVRIISTLKKLGIKSIVIYSQEDSKSQHVQDGDASFLLPGDSLAETYLSTEAILNIAKVSGAEAVIPGYGFLSESAEFAEACEASGLTWIGPTPQQMRSLGLKHLARQLAQDAGVPLLPGTGLIEDTQTAIAEADAIGYPVIVKSSAGGGGIGLQKCENVQKLREACESIPHLSQSFFKDGSIFLEKFVEDARHIEVQIIGNGRGLAKHAGERDCSLQRRKQKVIEEGPAVFVPEKVRKKMRKAAIKLATVVSYRGVGTVECIYNLKEGSFFFLEVNTRLQVEHLVTEAVTGLDLVEAMVRIAADGSSYLFSDSSDGFPAYKVAIEARIYGESPLQGFRPSPGQLLEVSFPAGVRIDTWITPGSVVSSSFDPLLAKLVVYGYDRAEAVRCLSAALEGTKLSGIETNVQYLKKIVRSRDFQNGTFTTTSLDEFNFQLPVFEVLASGPSTTIQDFPGRTGLWHIGVPPSGPMDDFAFRLANRILENDLGAAALECTHAGPRLLFHHDAHVAVVGGDATLQVDNVKAPLCHPVSVKAGQTLQLGVLEAGCRAYIAVKGGINVPQVFGSQSTFALGKIGGHCGRPLSIGDMISFDESSITAPNNVKTSFSSIIPPYSTSWNVKNGPERMEVPQALHPSNIHDSPYSIGSVSFTGDEAVILTYDGPNLGGFVVFATVISAEMWKIGQMKPGDKIFLTPVTASEAMLLDANLCSSINNASPLREVASKGEISDPILGDIGTDDMKILCRQAGDRAILLEFGDPDFDIRASFRIYGLIKAHNEDPIAGVVELTPGVRSLHVLYKPSVRQDEIIAALRAAVSALTLDLFENGIPSRTFYLPFAFEHSTSLAAIERYSRTIRSEAPWLPSNVEFLRRINGLDTKQDVNNILLSARYLVTGLGDVFFGAPCAVPLDPRHRLFGMKYNPSRSFTPEGTVGVGGQYLCIYGIDSPGGYQLVGRTVPIWNRWATQGNPWMFNVFDQIRFYSISEEALDAARASGYVEKLVTVVNGTFDLHAYENWLETHRVDIIDVTQKRWQTLHESDAVAQALQPPPALQFAEEEGAEGESSEDNFEVSTSGILLRAGVAGKCWKCAVSAGDIIEKGQTLFWIEAMKMEIKIGSPSKAVCKRVFVKAGDILKANSRMAELIVS